MQDDQERCLETRVEGTLFAGRVRCLSRALFSPERGAAASGVVRPQLAQLWSLPSGCVAREQMLGLLSGESTSASSQRTESQALNLSESQGWFSIENAHFSLQVWRFDNYLINLSIGENY